MKRLMAFFLVCVASSAVTSDANRSVVSNMVEALCKNDREFVGVCDEAICYRFVVENSLSVAAATVFLFQCFALPIVPAEQSVQLSVGHTFLVSDAACTFNKNNSRAVVPYKKNESLKNVKIRRNGRLQQPKN